MNTSAILATGGGTAMGLLVTVGYVAFFGIVIYFLMIKPQKKQQQRLKSLQDSVETGDSILTTSGFYGVVIGVEDDTVVVEFGNNKNCRIPMQKAAIVEVEKASEVQ